MPRQWPLRSLSWQNCMILKCEYRYTFTWTVTACFVYIHDRLRDTFRWVLMHIYLNSVRFEITFMTELDDAFMWVLTHFYLNSNCMFCIHSWQTQRCFLVNANAWMGTTLLTFMHFRCIGRELLFYLLKDRWLLVKCCKKKESARMSCALYLLTNF